jgi:hypothetical protein
VAGGAIAERWCVVSVPLYQLCALAFDVSRSGGKVVGFSIALAVKNRLTGAEYRAAKSFQGVGFKPMLACIVSVVRAIPSIEKTASAPGWDFELYETGAGEPVPVPVHGGMFCMCDICKASGRAVETDSRTRQ